MLKPTTAEVVARYQHPSWPADAAMTRNHWGKGEVSYVGFMPSDALAEKIMEESRQTGWPLGTTASASLSRRSCGAARWPMDTQFTTF